MKELLNRIHFEYILLGFTAAAALMMNEFPSFFSILPFWLISLIFAWRINLTKGIFCFAAATLLFICNYPAFQQRENELKSALNGKPLYGRVRFEITDPLCCSLPQIRNGATIQVKIISIRTVGGETFKGDGKYLIFAKDLIPSTSAYGDIFEVDGTVRFAETQSAWDSGNEIPDYDFRFGNFQQYMQLRKISGIIYPDKNASCLKIGNKNTLARKFLLLRDRILAYAVKGLNDVNANLTGALFFGLKGALDSESKQQFIKSGTIHLFSVSGLHIGILFTLLLPLTFFLSVRKRYLAATLLLIPFLLSTGANVPALRAFIIILIYALLRCFCFHVPALRVLAGGCAAFLIYKTAYLSDAGFLYSFGITGILLTGSEKISNWNTVWNIDRYLAAANRKKPHYFKKFLITHKKVVFAFCSTLAAFAGGSIITLAAFGYLYLSAVWINFFILFYSTLLIWLFIIKLLFTPLIWIGAFCASVFDGSLSFMQNIIEFGAEHPFQLNTVQIPIIYAVVFYFALLLLGFVRNKIAFTAALVTLISFFPCAILAARLQKPQLLLLRDPSSNQTAFVLADSRANYSWAYNIQNPQSMEIARKFLSSKGINHLNLWVQHGSAKSRINALNNAAKNLHISKVIHISRSPLSEKSALPAETVYDFRRQIGTKTDVKEKISRFFRKKDQFGFEYFDPEAILPLYVFFDNAKQTLFCSKNGKKHIKQWPNSNLTEYYIYDI